VGVSVLVADNGNKAMTTAYIIAARRTPIGKFLGGLATLPAPHLAALAMRAAMADSGLPAEAVDEVILGQVLTAGVGQAPARQAALAAGLPDTVPAVTVNKVCGSGLKAIMLADQAIRCGDAEVIVAGGMENMSLAPHLLLGSRTGQKYGDAPLVDSLIRDGLWCAFEQTAMGNLAEYTARTHQLTREQLDGYAAESHCRAIAAETGGAFARELTAIEVPGAKGTFTTIARDEGPRADTSLAALAKLRPAFDPQGCVTAGNSSQLSDGAAAVVVVSEEQARRATTPWQARIVATAVSGGPPKDLFIAPVTAIERVLARAGWQLADVDLLELNEAFASQTLACVKRLKIDPARVNVHGGAIALGHPIGCSGARVLTTLLHALVSRGASRGIAALCLGGGNAVAVAVERSEA
jgi:acetyl-CoA C-acetyltransferase